MRSNIYKTAAGTALLLLFCMSAFAADGAITLLEKGIADALDKIFADLQVWALGVLGGFMLLQFTWTHIHVLLNGAEWERIWSKFLGSLFWFGMCFYIFKEGPPFIKNVASEIMNKATGVTGVSFDPLAPIDKGIDVASQLLETFNGSQSVLGSLNPFPSIMLGLVSIVILAVSALLAFKIFMVFIETKMVIALSPLSFALLGLNAFKDQGLAPLKYLVSMALRMFLYGAVLAAMVVFSESIIATFKALPPSTDPSVWPPIWAAAIGYVLLGAVALRVDSIAAMLASGSSQMSTGDSAAVGAIAGAAAGAAMAAATGGASVAAAAAKPVQSMGDFMKSMGGGGSVSNASSRGMGGGSSSLPLSPPPVASLGSGSSGGPGAEAVAPEFETNKAGAPMNPDPNANVAGPANVDAVRSGASAPSSGSGSSANIGGTGSSSPGVTMDDLQKAMGQQNKPSATDRMRGLKDHVLNDAPPVSIQMNTHQD